MATLWWLGNTANGDCNQAANWTYYGPGTSGYAFGIQPSANIPKYDDTVIFDRLFYTGSSGGTGIYPIFAPIGDMRGLCGPAGNTAAQYFREVRVNSGCPVTIGGSTAFSFRTTILTIIKGQTANTPVGSTSKINLVDCAGVTKLNALVTIDSVKDHNYYITGTARQLRVRPIATLGASASREPISNIYLYGMNLTGLTTSNGDYYTLDYANASIIGNEPFVSTFNSQFNNASVKIYADSTTTCTGSIFLLGREKLIVDRGFVLSDLNLNLGKPDAFGVSPSLAQVEFRADSVQNATGADLLTRTTISKVFMYGNPTWDDVSTSQLPKVEVSHGTDFSQLWQYGTGLVHAAGYQQDDVLRVLRGYIAPAGQAYPQYNFSSPSIGILSESLVSNYGSAGRFIYDNFMLNPQPLRMSLYGNWYFTMTPLAYMPETL